MSDLTHYIPGAGIVPVRPGDGGMYAFLSHCWTWLPECALCGEVHSEVHMNRSEHPVCARCAEHLANLYHHARSGEYLTWEKTASELTSSSAVRRKPIGAALRSEILIRDAYRCRYCGGFEGGLVLDHVLPWSRGGADTSDNLVTACFSCNSFKRDRTPEEAGLVLREVPAE